MKKLLFLIPVLLISMGLKAQSDFREKFFLGFVSSYYLDFVSSPLKVVDLSTQFSTDTAAPFQTRYVSFISLGLEPRYNIKEVNDNIAFAVSMPFTVGFGQAFPHNEDITGATGYGNIQLPLLLKAYVGNSSTYNSTEEFGFSVGAGFELNKIGLIPLDEDNRIKEANTAWIMPVFSGSVHFWRGSTPLEINFKYGRGEQSTYSKTRYGQQLPDGERTTRANSIKLSFVYLFDS